MVEWDNNVFLSESSHTKHQSLICLIPSVTILYKYIHSKRTLSITIAELCLQYKYYVLLELEGVIRHVPINMDKL